MLNVFVIILHVMKEDLDLMNMEIQAYFLIQAYITTWPVASEFGKKMAIGQAEQDPKLPRSASNVLCRVLAMR